MKFEPIKLLPAFKDYLWGGTRLRTEYNKKTELEKVAESWELSTHKDGQSVVASGEHSGMLLGEYVERFDVLGNNAKNFDFFPILIKFIDAKDNLSVQVHPADEYSLRNNGEYGKTEMWYVLDCEPGASLYYGFNREIDKDEFRKRIADNTLLEVLNKVPVKKGDIFFIEAGTVHAIGKGIMICEIQQNSNTTYRVYDYDRRDSNGNTRPLHIEQAIEVSDLFPPNPQEKLPENVLASCKYFTVEKYDVRNSLDIPVTEDCFKSVIVLDGKGEIEYDGGKMEVAKGDSIFIPAQNGAVKITGECEIIVSYV